MANRLPVFGQKRSKRVSKVIKHRLDKGGGSIRNIRTGKGRGSVRDISKRKKRPSVQVPLRSKSASSVSKKPTLSSKLGKARPPNNTTCDIYHIGNAPPSTPDEQTVEIHLSARFQSGSEASEGDQDFRWTHLAFLHKEVDVRDAWPATPGSSLYVPDKDGTKFNIVFVELVHRGTPQEHKRAFLERQSVTWPSDEL